MSNNSYKDAFSKIRFSPDFQERAKVAMKEAGRQRQNNKHTGIERVACAAMGILVCAALIVFTISGPFGDGILSDVVCSVILSVNPSVEFQLDENNMVLDVVGLNEDGEALIEGLDFCGLSFENAAIIVVNRLIVEDYISAAHVRDEIQLSVQGKLANKDTLDVMSAFIQSAASLYKITVNAQETGPNVMQLTLTGNPETPEVIDQPSVLRLGYIFDAHDDNKSVEKIELYPDDGEKLPNFVDFSGMETLHGTFHVTHTLIQKGYISDRSDDAKIIYELPGYDDEVLSGHIKLLKLMVQEAGLSLEVEQTGAGQITLSKSENAAPERTAKYTIRELIDPLINKSKSDATPLQMEILTMVFAQEELDEIFQTRCWVMVPNLIGLTEQEALKLWEQAGLEPLHVYRKFDSDTIDAIGSDFFGKVCGQDSVAGDTAQVGVKFAISVLYATEEDAAAAAMAAMDKTVEQRALEGMGLDFPFDYSDKQRAIDANIVVTTEKETFNSRELNRFIITHRSVDGNLIIVHYNGDTVEYVYALLSRFGSIECERVQDGQRMYYFLSDLKFDNGIAYAVDRNYKKMILAENVTVSAADMAQQLKLPDMHASLSYIKGPTFDEKIKRHTITIKASQLIDLLEQETGESEEMKNGAFEILQIRGNCDGFRCELNGDGSVVFQSEGYRFVSYSEPLYDGILKLAGLKKFTLNRIEKTSSITIRKKLESGEIQTIEINDEQTIREITDLMVAAEYSAFDYYFQKVDVEMTLHTDDGDIMCRLLSAPDEYQSEIFQINRLYCFESQKFLDYVRSLL